MSEVFDWNFPGLSWSHFHSIANLLSIRNGGQAEPPASPDTIVEGDWEPSDHGDQDAAGVGTSMLNQISDSGHGRLKRKFLDCLAEFAANKKSGTAVACTAMQEAEDHVLIWIACNEGFLDTDGPVFDRLGKTLGSLSSGNDSEAETLLWKYMVKYQQSRIEDSYIPSLRISFKTYDASRRTDDTNTSEAYTMLEDNLSPLRSLLFNRNTGHTSTLAKYMDLVTASYELRQTKNIEEMLYSSPRAASKSKSLWLDICMLARLRIAFQSFKDASLMLPNFAQVTFILIPHPEGLTLATPPEPQLNLEQTFNILQVNFSPTTMKAIVGQNWTFAKIEHEFAERQRCKLNVHAEVQMLIFLNTIGASASSFFKYLGCNKLSCFMCNRFLQLFGGFTTRGCHGRLFKPWTVPNLNNLLPGRATWIALVLIVVQEEVIRTLKASITSPIQHERTLVTGGSSFFGGQQEDSHRQSQIGRLRMKSERDRVTEAFGRQTEDAAGQDINTCTAAPDAGWECDICMRMTRRRCSICNKGSFCSEPCQEKRSGSHLLTCSKSALTSADDLWKSLGYGLMPQEEDVLEDFGFNNVLSAADQSNLFWVYYGIYQSGKFSAEDIHKWRVAGTLEENIKEFYYGIPDRSSGGPFSWLLKNPYILAQPLTGEKAQEERGAAFHNKARPYLDNKDSNKMPRYLQPEAKRDCYYILAAVLHQYAPHPMDQQWYSFGFVTCRGKVEESILLAIYQLLITESDGSFFYEFHNRRREVTQPATFTQFWKAYEARTLIKLMDSKGLENMRSNLPFLEAFLSVPPAGPRPSVWDLKQFLEIDDPVNYPPIPSVSFGYGFMNCRTLEERCTLMEIYRKVLKIANPLELHLACMSGTLFEFASKYIRMKKHWSPLMKNFYPLETVVKLPRENNSGLSSLLSGLREWLYSTVSLGFLVTVTVLEVLGYVFSQL